MSTIGRIESKLELAVLAKLLLLAGGLILLIIGLLQVANIRYSFDLNPGLRDFASLTGLSSGVLAMLVGALALLGSRRVSNPAWNVVLLVLGLIVSGLGGILVFIAGLMGLAEAFIRK